MGRAYPRISRLLRVIRVTQGRAGITIRELESECKISRRTIYRDINTLNDSGFPCRYDAETGGYRIPRSFFMPPVELTFEASLAMLILAEHAGSDTRIPHLDLAL